VTSTVKGLAELFKTEGAPGSSNTCGALENDPDFVECGYARRTLPPGVVLDRTSGLITGTPRAAATRVPYTITASSPAGNTSFVLLLAVSAPSPRGAY
jgi:hypothetical protein